MNIGIAGCGFMGDVHAEAYKKLGSNIYAIAEKNEAKLNSFANKFQPIAVYQDVVDMIMDDKIDLIDICLPTPFHKEIAVRALLNNKNVLLEKPIALSLDDALEIKKAAQKSSAEFMVAHVLRFWPEYSIIRKQINQKSLGKIKEIYASRFNEPPLWSDGTWIMDENQSGGLIIDLMIHDIDFIAWNFGKIKRVWSTGGLDSNNFHTQVFAVMEFNNGSKAYVEGGYLNPKGSGLNSQMRIYGDKAKLEMYSHEDKIILKENNNEKTILLDIPVIDGYVEEVTYFMDAIDAGKAPSVISVDEAIESLSVCLALKKSLKEGNWIELV